MSHKVPSGTQKVDPASVVYIKSFIKLVDSVEEITEIKRSREVARGSKDKGMISFKMFYENRDNGAFEERLRNIARECEEMAKHYSATDNMPDVLLDVQSQKLLREKIPPEISLWLSFDLVNKVCEIVNRKSLFDLYEEAKSGNEKSLFTLLRHDKTLFDHDG